MTAINTLLPVATAVAERLLQQHGNLKNVTAKGLTYGLTQSVLGRPPRPPESVVRKGPPLQFSRAVVEGKTLGQLIEGGYFDQLGKGAVDELRTLVDDPAWRNKGPQLLELFGLIAPNANTPDWVKAFAKEFAQGFDPEKVQFAIGKIKEIAEGGGSFETLKAISWATFRPSATPPPRAIPPAIRPEALFNTGIQAVKQLVTPELLQKTYQLLT
jgi:hypothetical protein